MSFDAEQLVDRYIQIRDKIGELEAQHKAQLAPYKEALGKVERLFLAKFNEDGVKSVRTNAGTAFTENTVSVTVADWQSFLEYIRANELWDLLGHYASKTAVKTFREENDDLPPGLNWREIATVKVRRS